ncbi:MAG: hypothetical protein N2510_03320 [Ignavibacteria bacterium]|nr:hypothetical protein [Ignavibacteria bacterium]
MKLAFRILRVVNKFEISPIGKPALHKFAIYFLWGFNVSLFLGPDFNEILQLNKAHFIGSYIDIIKLKKNDLNRIADLNYTDEKEDLNLFAFTSSCNCITGVHDVILNVIARGPPHISTLFKG